VGYRSWDAEVLRQAGVAPSHTAVTASFGEFQKPVAQKSSVAEVMFFLAQRSGRASISQGELGPVRHNAPFLVFWGRRHGTRVSGFDARVVVDHSPCSTGIWITRAHIVVTFYFFVGQM
jgi:hypothetical protein